MNFSISYLVGKTKHTISFAKSFLNEHFDIQVNINNERVTLGITPCSEIELLSFTGWTERKFTDEKIFANGYQSWTESKEYCLRQKMTQLPIVAKILNPIFKFSQYGDYNIFQKKLKQSEIYGYSGSYIRSNDNYEFYISENEDIFHTIFVFSKPDSRVYFFADCTGTKISSRTTLLNICTVKGNRSSCIDYFSKTGKNTSVQPKIGWTSWYNYYQNINETLIVKNLEAFNNIFPKSSIFQIDDGYQTRVGDWLDIDHKKFPNGLQEIVEKTHSYGYEAGLWLAPFAAQKNSTIVKNHPEWVLKDKYNNRVIGGGNWGGFFVLDFYNENFREYLRKVFNTVLFDWKFDMVKLDFLYAVSVIPQKGKSRAMVMAEALAFLREITGTKKILGCGVPLSQAFNRVEYCRVGPDIGLDWNGKFFEKHLHRERVSTYNTLKNTIYRSFFDKTGFLNDPDVFLLRDENIILTKNQKVTLFLVNTIFGSLVFTSDNINQYKTWQTNLISNIGFFHSAQVVAVSETNDLFEYHFCVEGKNFTGLSNLSAAEVKLEMGELKLLNIFNLETESKNIKTIQPFETIVYERFK